MSGPKKISVESVTGSNDYFWRVDWFGYLKYPVIGQFRNRSKMPYVDLIISRLFQHPSETDYLNANCSAVPYQKIKSVPVEMLACLRIGDIWHKGELFEIPSYESFEFSFSPDDSETIVAGEQFDSDNFEYWISYHSHPYHRKATQVYCEKIQVSSTQYVVIPHYVILQAYFSRCSFVFRKIFEFGIDFDDFFNSTKTSLGDGNPGIITLRKSVHDVAAEEVARIAWDEKAHSAIKKVSDNFAIQNSSGRKVRPKTIFPFSSTTSMKVRGKWCGINDRDQSFIVFDITECTASFPFESLIHYRDNPGGKGGNQGEKPPTPDASGLNLPPSPNAPDGTDLDTDEEPSNWMGAVDLGSRSSIDYIDLLDKEVEKKDNEATDGDTEFCGDYVRFSEVDVNNLAVGDGVDHGEAAPAQFSAEDVSGPNNDQIEECEDNNEDNGDSGYIFKNKICRITLFRTFCMFLIRELDFSDFRYRPICPDLNGQKKTKFSYFPKSRTERGRERMWRYINYFKGEGWVDGNDKRVRRCLIFQFRIGKDFYYLLEAERRIKEVDGGWKESDQPALLKLRSRELLSDEVLQDILRDTLKKRGTWAVRNEANLFVERIRHPHGSTIEDGTYTEKMREFVDL